ncbi:M15 family metallopeptidase [Fervidicoccus fontis]|uniref:D-alanyl-D-alanine dipeptidase n=1 Tax=Fervidicoccus fontis TaxID=683846 RepID=A0A7C2ZQK2_9CREN|nr:M15 family metallopeptidase [Fervidicoccus fontis]PMB76789.1 MAG: D-alanyl-D-alanine dipeptidase [Fervidicoccus fontis]HEW64473.1 D-alanyl-D-alanine dipeptidase [Fervidicoccus fontis]
MVGQLKKIDTSIIERAIPIPSEEWNWNKIRSIKIIESNEPLVPLSLVPEHILCRPQYYIQGIGNSLPECYSRKGVLLRLLKASSRLPSEYKLVILDAWRPITVQQSLFDTLKERIMKENPLISEEEAIKETLKFVALPSKDPNKPSPHNTGGAIDLTIADENGLFLNMGTDYDDTTEKARTTYFEEKVRRGEKLSEEEEEALKNRRLLYNIMIDAGFTNYFDEWWHYDYGNQNWAWLSGKDNAIYGKAKVKFTWKEFD